MGEEQNTFRFKLKVETASAHKVLEERVNAVGLTGRLHDYVELLSRFLALYRPLEEALRRLEWGNVAIDFAGRRKLPWLERDLKILGCDPEAIGDWLNIPRVTNANEGLGVLYVMEGASLGGQLIGKWLHSELGIGSGNGGRFFSSYGGRIGEMWRTFLNSLESAAQLQSNADAIQQSALHTFQCFESCLEQMQTKAAGQELLRRKAF